MGAKTPAACLKSQLALVTAAKHCPLMGIYWVWLYHGCDGVEDLHDGILTLPAALAIRDPAVAKMFCALAQGDLSRLAEAFSEQLPEAKWYLDSIASEAATEACLFSRSSDQLMTLIDYTRELSLT